MPEGIMKHTPERDRRSQRGGIRDTNGRGSTDGVRDNGIDYGDADESGDRLDPRGSPRDSHSQQRERRVGGAAVVARAKEQLVELTGQACESVSALSRTRQGWRVVLEVLELERIPRTTDILASYAVDLDENGDLLGYARTHRYYRNDVDGDQ